MSPERYHAPRSREHVATRRMAWQTLVNFHALLYPEEYQGRIWRHSGIADEAHLLSRDTKPYVKLQIIRANFMPVVEALFPQSVPGEPYTLRKRMADYCQEQIHIEDEDLFVNADNQLMTAEEILPSEEMLWTMYTTWRQNETAYCRPLQRDILVKSY